MGIEMKIMFGALIFIVGWFYFYICVRQLVFDFTVGYPLINTFGAGGDAVINRKNAARLNTISVIIWFAICVGLGYVVIRFCPLYLLICFWAGALIGLAAFFNKLGPATKSNFEAFCRTYYRFMPDDELRTAVYNSDVPHIRAALRALGADVKFTVKD